MNYLQKKKLAFMSIVNKVKGFIRTITGALPLTLEGCVDEESIIDYTLYGNSVQDGTPTPDTPIEVESVGEKTRNLITATDGYIVKHAENRYIKYDAKTQVFTIQGSALKEYVYLPETIPSGTTTSIFVEIVNDDYEIVKNTLQIGGYGIVASWQNLLSFSTTSQKKQSMVRTITKDTDKICIFVDANASVKNVQVRITYAVCDTEFTEYEPYGYKIPIKASSNGKTVTTNIYLDEPLRKVSNSDCLYYENQICARRVKEYICKGNEGWYKNGEKDGLVRYFLGGITPVGTAGQRSILTNMYPQINNFSSDWWQLNTVQAWGFTTQAGWIGVCVSIEDFPTVTDFKNFVATKYSEGNPLKMYFEISATETPITLPTIPTFKGTSIVSADTTVQPSNAEIEYYSNVKE